ncbi:hypothetical protein B296_00029930 [Ensete ventricosum]|uniref:Uncharacterized protein n=1 Tax=Ensete ventricosum TaxID=4639 RepID=A0A426XA17_ENSVE|nr:hypothetical protein B296_00029930 [Ensete ventricosum]
MLGQSQDRASRQGSNDAAGARWEFAKGDQELVGSSLKDDQELTGVRRRMPRSSPGVHRRTLGSSPGVWKID